MPEAWAEAPAKQSQKDVDARWTKKNAEVHYGFKNHVKAEAKSKLLERYAVTDARVHDSQQMAELVATEGAAVYADPDTACRGTETEALLAHQQSSKTTPTKKVTLKPATPETEPSPSTQLRKVVFGGSRLNGGSMFIRQLFVFPFIES